MSWADDQGFYEPPMEWFLARDAKCMRGRQEGPLVSPYEDKKLKRIEENNMAKFDNNSTKVVTGKVRLSYVHLLEPSAMEEGDEKKYSTQLLIPKDDKATISKIRKAQKTAWEAEKDGKLKGVKWDNCKLTLRDGDEEDTEEKPELAGHYFMNVSSKTAPGIIDKYKSKVDSDDEVYSGVYARVSINFYGYNHKGNKGVTAGLNNVQIIAKGDYLGGKASADSDFDEWEDEEDDDDLM